MYNINPTQSYEQAKRFETGTAEEKELETRLDTNTEFFTSPATLQEFFSTFKDRENIERYITEAIEEYIAELKK